MVEHVLTVNASVYRNSMKTFAKILNEGGGAGWIIVILILLIALIAGAIYVFTRNPDSLLNKQNFSAGLGKRMNLY